MFFFVLKRKIRSSRINKKGIFGNFDGCISLDPSKYLPFKVKKLLMYNDFISKIYFINAEL